MNVQTLIICHYIIYLPRLLIHFIHKENPKGYCLLFYNDDNSHNKKQTKKPSILIFFIYSLESQVLVEVKDAQYNTRLLPSGMNAEIPVEK